MSSTRIITAIFAGLFWIITGAGLSAQNAWETLPVFHGGRIMPMHTFAEQMVRDICTTERPYIVWDNNIIAEFNHVVRSMSPRQQDADTSKQYQYVIPDGGRSTGGFDKSYSAFDMPYEVEPASATFSLQGLSPERISGISNRIQQLIPMDGRYFRADELILSWISEPEIWQFIPIFYAPKEYIDEFFDITFSEHVPASQYRVSLYQLEQSQRFKLRSAEIQRRYQSGQHTPYLVPFDQITGRLERQMQFFRGLTFHPQRQRPTRMLAILYQTAGYTTEYSGTNSGGGRSSYMSAFEFWGNLLTLGEVPSRQSMERSSRSDPSPLLHPTTERWHRIMDKLRLIMQIYNQPDAAESPTLPQATLVEQQYEILIGLIDEHLAESAALMEAVYPGISYRAESGSAARVVDVDQLLPRLLSEEDHGSPPMESRQMQTIRQMVIQYHDAVKRLRHDMEAAYLALYDNGGRSLRFLPLVSPYALNTEPSQDISAIQPWASAQMILGSGDFFTKRFLEPQLVVLPALPPAEEPLAKVNSGNRTDSDNSAESGHSADTSDSLAAAGKSDRAETASGGEEDEADSHKAASNESDSGEAAESADVDTERVSPVADLSVEDMLKKVDSEMTEQALIEWLLLPYEWKGGILQTRQDKKSRITSLRNLLKSASRLRSSLGRFESAMEEYGNRNFNVRSQEFAQAVRVAAEQIDHVRSSFVLKEDQAAVELLNQTTYPKAGATQTEYRYTRLRLFYWMGFFALLAALLNICAYLTASSRDRSVVSKSVSILFSKRGIKKEQTLQDYTHSVEEWLFAASAAMLLISILTAFLGGVMRARITGWTPVTNMYETIVMMAFITAVLGVWYSFSPLLNPALKLSWELSRFPRMGSWLWRLGIGRLISHSARQGATDSEPDSDAAKREIIKEWGLPEGEWLAGQSFAGQQHDHHAAADRFRQEKAVRRKILGQYFMAIPRLVLSWIVLWMIVWMSNSSMLAQQGFMPAFMDMFKTTDAVDFIAVLASVLLMVWVLPHVVSALFLTPLVLCRSSWVAAELEIFSCESMIAVQEASKASIAEHSRLGMNKVFHGETQKQHVIAGAKNTSGTAWLKIARNAALDRKLFIAVAAVIVFVTSVIVSWNRVEFNPDIRPIMPVLRSNFWLTIHVIAIVASYAAALVAWGMAVVSLGYVLFGRYQRIEPKTPGGKMRVRLPAACHVYEQVIERLVKTALLLLVVGTVLGARWADYSWGRFWSWDPKEVWALVTILYYTIVLHGKAARYYGSMGIVVGALFGSIPIIITWYGINFVFKGSVHSYGGGAAGSTLFIAVFMMVNILWGALALLRYSAEFFGNAEILESETE